jgi:hypothetical protein
MAYALNKICLITQPTKGKWVDQPSLGISGSGHDIYPTVYEFEMFWGAVDRATYKQIYDVWANQSTGTVVSTLPTFGTSTETTTDFEDYTGTIIAQPTRGDFFEEGLLNVTLKVRNINV